MRAAGPTRSRPRRRIGRYLVTGRIGRGGMGMVYRGRDEALERDVAVKTLGLEGVLDGESRARFEIEAKAAARLQHPNIVTIFELGEERGLPFIAMELLPGADLETLLRSGEELLLEEKLDVVVQVARGLAYAHERGVVHRDMKPSNIRVLDDGRAKIMDFGIAKLGSTALTQRGIMVGTVHYMSPEQIRGAALDGRSDVFSLGVILYELLSGRRPFVGAEATQVLYRIAHEPPAPLEGDWGAITPRLRAIVDRALAKQPAERQASAAALAGELEGVLEALRRERENPAELELRRALRTAQRAVSGRQAAQAVEDDFPELDATFRAPPTLRTTGTLRYEALAGPGPAPAGVAARPAAGRRVLAATAAGVLALLAAGAWVLLRPPAAPPVTRVLVRSPLPREPVGFEPGALPLEATLRVSSDPAGAEVALDGAGRGRTPLELRYDTRRAHRLVFTLEGHKPGELALEPGARPGQVSLTLAPSGPSGTLSIASSYPLDVLWQGRVLARGQANPRLTLPPGRYTLTLVAPQYFLGSPVSVTVKSAAESALRAPGLGRLNVRATPDNCEVHINGAFADYPPIRDRPVAAGRLTVSFKWPDGTRRDETVELAAGGIEYVTGRKE